MRAARNSSAAWRAQMAREEERFPPYFTPELKAKRDERFQAWMAQHVRWLVPNRFRGQQ